MVPYDQPVRIGVVLYDGVEPIDLGGTLGVISMAARLLPGLTGVAIAETAGPVRCAGGLTVIAAHGFADAPECDAVVVTGGPGWRAQSENPAMLAYLRGVGAARLASVCTGALILGAAGLLMGARPPRAGPRWGPKRRRRWPCWRRWAPRRWRRRSSTPAGR